MSHGGKGSSPRPIEIPREQFGNNFERTFGTLVTCPHCGERMRIRPDVPYVHNCTQPNDAHA